MPREPLPALRGEKAPSEPSFEEQREALFEKVMKDPSLLKDREQMVKAVSAIFQYSTEDGMRIAERLAFQPKEYISSILNPAFALRHPKIYFRLAWTAQEHLVRTGTPEEKLFDQNMGSLHQALDSGPGQSVSLTEEAAKVLKRQKRFSEIETFYEQVFVTREPKLQTLDRGKDLSDVRSSGERLGEEYLDSIKEVLERRFYTGPVKEMFPALAHDPAFIQPTLEEHELRGILKKYHVESDAAIAHLAPARVVAYRQLDSMKRGVAQRELVKEVNNLVPEGKMVKFDPDAEQYRIVDVEGQSKEKKKEVKNETERRAVFEKRALEEIEKLFDQISHPSEKIRCLTGLDSSRAWELREELLKQGASAIHVAQSLVGLDSERAWQMRKKLLKQGVIVESVVMGLIGVDSDRAWQTREQALKDGAVPDSLAKDLAGLDSDRAWQMREQFLERDDVDYGDVMLGLAGVDSERAWQLRMEFMRNGKAEGPVLKSLAGLDSDRAWQLRENFFRNRHEMTSGGLFMSLNGLDSDRAWEMRQTLFSEVQPWRVAVGIGGLDSPKAEQMRDRLRRERVKPATLAASFMGEGFSALKPKSPKTTEKHIEKKESLTAFDEKVLDEMEKLLELGANPILVVECLAGMDSDRAWEMRARLVGQGRVTPGDALSGLAGLDSSLAWEMREMYFQGDGKLLESLVGLDSPKAWEMRRRLQRTLKVSDKLILPTLAGVDSDQAWEMRDIFFRDNFPERGHFIATSLRGLDSERAWQMREQLLKSDHRNINSIIQSLVGLDSDRAWKIRERFFESHHGAQSHYFSQSLAGLDSDRAWKMREQIFGEYLSESLAGVDSPRAWKMRESLNGKRDNKNSMPLSLSGDYNTFLWRMQAKWKSESRSGPWEERRVNLLNLMHDPTLEGIEAYEEQYARPVEQGRATLDRRHVGVLGDLFSDREAAKALLETNPAIPDRASERLVEKLLQRMVPSYAKKEQPSLWSRVRSGFRNSELSPVTGAVADRTSYELMGAGTENLADARRVLESREQMDELLVNGVYGRYEGKTQKWEKVYIPVRRESTEHARETTFTLVDVAGVGRASLLMPFNARLITERVRGIMQDGREVPLEPSLNSLGEAAVDVPPGIVKIIYSIELPFAPEPIHDPSSREFEKFLHGFERDHGRDMSGSLARLPYDLEAELRTPAFKALTPKQKVFHIEEMVRRVSWYDVKNQEVSGDKVGKSPEEQARICEDRLEALRAAAKPSEFAGKKFAGVCGDFAQITCALLRKAGLPAGILSGFHLNGKNAEMKDAHATAFVPWPDGRGGTRIIPVDGTPSSSESIAATVARPSLAEREKLTEKVIAAEVAIAEKILTDLLKSVQANDVASIRKLTNSKLEHALNVILQYEVKEPHLRAVEGMLSAYWYAGLHRLEGITAEIEMRKALEEEVARERSAAQPDEAGQPAGTRLLETVREFVGKFERSGAAVTRDKAFDMLDRITSLSKEALSDVETRALVVVVQYLRAQKMR